MSDERDEQEDDRGKKKSLRERLPPPRRILQVTAPLVAVATLMVALRIGAGDAVRAAVVFGAPLGQAGPDGKTLLALQLLTFLDDRGVKETIPMRDLTVRATTKRGTAEWKGSSNVDGIAEASLALDGLVEGESVELEVTVAGEKKPLAAGGLRWPAADARPPPPVPRNAGVRFTKRTGPVDLDVVIEGERLVPGFPTPVWVRAHAPAGVGAGRLVVDALPEPGLLVERETSPVCGASTGSGFAAFAMTAQAHVVGSVFKAKDSATRDPDPKLAGDWLGGMPVAPGAFFISVDRHVNPGEAFTIVLVAPNPRDVVYAEIDDEKGRVFAGALAVKTEAGDPTPRARFEVPGLAPGLHWVVASGEPRGSEHMGGAAIGRAFLVGDAPAGDPKVDVRDSCSLGPWLAQRSAPGVGRYIALDGLPARSAANRFRYRMGMLLGLVSLLAAGILETLLLIAASREARIALALAELDDDDKNAEKVTAKPPGGGLVLALLVAILGFALLAVLLVAKA